MNRITRWIVTRKLRGWEKKHMEKITKVVEWLNATPGRKRGIAAVLLGVAAAVRALGHTEAATLVESANQVVQTYVVPGMDFVGFLFAFAGLWNAKAKGTL